MGIDNLYKIIEEHAPGSLENYHLSQLSGLRIAVDISIILFKVIKTAGDDWLSVFINFLAKFIKHHIITVCIFDGKNMPKEKDAEHYFRKKESDKANTKLEECVQMRNKLFEVYLSQDDEEDLSEEDMKECRRLLYSRSSFQTINYYIINDVVEALNEKIIKLENQTKPITQECKDLAFEAVNLMGLHAIQCDGEAEAVCCYLAREGQVHGVLSEDTDCLVYGAPFMFAFRKFKMSDEKVVGIHFQTILDSTRLTHHQFIQMCILLRCDYNRHTRTHREGEVYVPTIIKGFIRGKNGELSKKATNLGVKKIWDLMLEYGSYEEIEKILENPEDVKYQRCMELFTMKPDLPFDEMFQVNLVPDLEKLGEFIDTHKVWVDINNIKRLLEPTPIVFEDGDGDSTSTGEISSDDIDLSSEEDDVFDKEDDVEDVFAEPGCSLEIHNVVEEYLYHLFSIDIGGKIVECGVRFPIDTPKIKKFTKIFPPADFGVWLVSTEKVSVDRMKYFDEMKIVESREVSRPTCMCYTYT